MTQPAPPPEPPELIQVVPADFFAPATLTTADIDKLAAAPSGATHGAPEPVCCSAPSFPKVEPRSDRVSWVRNPATVPAPFLRASRDRPHPQTTQAPLLARLEQDLTAFPARFTLREPSAAEKTSSEAAAVPVDPLAMHADVPPALSEPAAIAPAPASDPVALPNGDRTDAAALLGQPISIGYAPPPEGLGLLPDFAIEPSYALAPLIALEPPPAVTTAPTLEQAELSWGEESGPLQPTPPTHLRTQTRDGEWREFEFRTPTDPEELPEVVEGLEEEPGESLASPPEAGRSELERLIEDPPRVRAPVPLPSETLTPADALEISADRQQFNERQRVVTAQGNVVMRFARGILTADRVRVNLPNRYVFAEGNVALRRGEQVLRGDRFEYQIVQDRGIVHNARGEINQRRTDVDFAPVLGNDPIADAILPTRPLSDRVLVNQPFEPTAEEGYELTIGGLSVQTNPDGSLGAPTLQTGTRGDVYRVRFEAEYVEFDAEGWQARNIRFTNDPFSPPELEVRADTANLTRLNEFQDEIITTNSRLWFDGVFSVPIFQDRILIDRREDESGLFNIGFDDSDRGGLFIERGFTVINRPWIRWKLTPQLLVQRAIFEEGFFDLDAFGIRSNLNIFMDERTELSAATSLSSLDVNKYQTRLRNDLRLRRAIGRLDRPHFLTLQYTFRDRLFNGSLGLQTVQTSFGAIFTSPVIALGDSGVNLTYQSSIQRITADTDRQDLLQPGRKDDRITLTRYQGAASVSRAFTLWSREPLPPTAEEGLRYTPRPVQPFVNLNTGLTTVLARYSSGDSQELVSGSIGLQGQFGHFSRPYLDYTAFNITYLNSLVGERSPFLFDRFVDQQVLSFGITQQIYGPFRVGFQTSYNLDSGQEISTDYTLEYSRRTYGVIFRYNPVLSVASFQVRIGDFNWLGNPEPFSGSGLRPVIQGVTR